MTYSSSEATGHGFTGERWGAYSQLLFLRARYYEPGTGRFVSKDPWSGNIQQPSTLQGWTYVQNNPLALVDIEGLSPIRYTVFILPVDDPEYNVCYEEEWDPPHGILPFPPYGARSLGTVVWGGTSVISHDHFSGWAEADYVLFGNYRGEWIKLEKPEEVDRRARWFETSQFIFKEPIRIAASAPVGDPFSLKEGEMAEVVYEQNDQMYSVPYEVHELIWGNEPQAIFLDPWQTINRGDSGGGLFKDGQLVGNTWQIVISLETNEHWFISALLGRWQ